MNSSLNISFYFSKNNVNRSRHSKVLSTSSWVLTVFWVETNGGTVELTVELRCELECLAHFESKSAVSPKFSDKTQGLVMVWSDELIVYLNDEQVARHPRLFLMLVGVTK